MIRPFTILCVLCSGFSGLFLYSKKHQTTVLNQQIASIVHDTQRIHDQTSMLKTEWSLLNQPDRLKTLSAKILPSLASMRPDQFVQLASLSSRLPSPITKPLINPREDLGRSVAADHDQATPETKKETEIPDSSEKTLSTEEKVGKKDLSKEKAPTEKESKKPVLETARKSESPTNNSNIASKAKPQAEPALSSVAKTTNALKDKKKTRPKKIEEHKEPMAEEDIAESPLDKLPPLASINKTSINKNGSLPRHGGERKNISAMAANHHPRPAVTDEIEENEAQASPKPVKHKHSTRPKYDDTLSLGQALAQNSEKPHPIAIKAAANISRLHTPSSHSTLASKNVNASGSRTANSSRTSSNNASVLGISSQSALPPPTPFRDE
ncbi:cell division protein FtsL [Entomobacter blattae]|uniref:Uncharacterized protein n=1 Tax=Entomobacter blattae TaxID=2762277 RepID=A0A7H1NNR3_9PROT|nr:hypothetical protein [Entomobacter blattae]QNT77423.1 hypothetical protein JGUZn3_01580 [Entomobacter blattae]